jgi:hypothetical protein
MTVASAFEAARNFLFYRQTAYRATFQNVPGATVLADLAVFCRACRSTFHKDPYVAGRLDGRREVWLRIQSHLQLTQEQLWKLQSGE